MGYAQFDNKTSRYNDYNSQKNNSVINQKVVDLVLKDKTAQEYSSFLQELNNFCTVTSSQLRNLYEIIQGISKLDKKEQLAKIIKLRIMIEYAIKKGNIKDDSFSKTLVLIIDNLIKKITDENAIKNFEEFMESIIAFAKK